MADFRFERSFPGETGFLIGAARLRVRGALDAGFDDDLQTDFVGGPRLLDARVGWALSRSPAGTW